MLKAFKHQRVIMQVVRNRFFPILLINLTRNSLTFRPLELNVQLVLLFYRCSSVNEREHIPDRLMLVLYPAFVVVSSVFSSCFYLRTSKVHKVSVFKEHTLVCPLWKSLI